MDKVAVVIPNYNGYRYLETCFAALAKQTFTEFTTYFVDNGSQDESCAFLREHYPETKIIQLDDNYGFSRAVNEGIRRSKEPYVILLNNDTEVFPDFVERLYEGICKRKNAFACSAKLISYQERDKIDDAGNYYNMLGWAFARGKGKPVSEFETSDRIFAACAGAAIYRREFLEKTGLFDEEHFAYLEDTDIGYRARLLGYENWYEPSAKVYHVGSGTSGSRYNLTVKVGTQINLRNPHKSFIPDALCRPPACAQPSFLSVQITGFPFLHNVPGYACTSLTCPRSADRRIG